MDGVEVVELRRTERDSQSVAEEAARDPSGTAVVDEHNRRYGMT